MDTTKPKSKAGRKKGSKDSPTAPRMLASAERRAEKILLRDMLRKKFLSMADKLFTAQADLATGLHVVMVKTEKGWQRLEDPRMLEATMNSLEEGRFWKIHTTDPSVPAFNTLAYYAMDKPSEILDLDGETAGNGTLIVRWRRDDD